MPFSHHSHSGEFCLHAKDTLKDIIEAAIMKGMKVLALTEHMPRDQPEDLYPEEVLAAEITNFDLWRMFADYYAAALHLRDRYAENIHILVGFEIDYIRPSSVQLIQRLQQDYKFDLFIGSVHHVNGIPIDFDKNMYIEAQESCGGTEELLFQAYFDAQFEMLVQLKPPIVAHFDLIRLFSDNSDLDLRLWPRVWEKVERNVQYIVDYGGLFELNSASFRKGWNEPYPRRDICELTLSKGGRFTFSDDSHEMAQVGLNYHELQQFAESLGINKIHYLERLPMGRVAIDCLGPCQVHSVTLAELRQDDFFKLCALSKHI
ncbi:Polymerase/histidinol phosphatase-like protein [Kalaharituber pfeilii]|nr:Polymerase/histidinol phosphatase-like protein [Kalaharituber pfeilii]